MFARHSRHTSPATRKAIRDDVARQMEHMDRMQARGFSPSFKLTPSAKAALTVSTAMALVGWVQGLQLPF